MAFTVHSLSTDRFFEGKFECQKDIHLKTQPGPVAKNSTPVRDTTNLGYDDLLV